MNTFLLILTGLCFILVISLIVADLVKTHRKYKLIATVIVLASYVFPYLIGRGGF